MDNKIIPKSCEKCIWRSKETDSFYCPIANGCMKLKENKKGKSDEACCTTTLCRDN